MLAETTCASKTGALLAGEESVHPKFKDLSLNHRSGTISRVSQAPADGVTGEPTGDLLWGRAWWAQGRTEGSPAEQPAAMTLAGGTPTITSSTLPGPARTGAPFQPSLSTSPDRNCCVSNSLQVWSLSSLLGRSLHSARGPSQ